MLRLSLAALLASLSLAQTAATPPASPQPPADVDRALRARIKTFYGLLVDRKYRKAEDLVAPDYRDIYYDRDKPAYLSYELTSISYSADFTRADVVVAVRMPPIHPLVPATTNVPVESIWRLLDGEWYWSQRKIDALELVRRMAGGSVAPAGAGPVAGLPPMAGGVNLPPALQGGAGLPSALPGSVSLPAVLGRPEAMAMAANTGVSTPAFSMDRTEVALKPSTTETVKIANTGSTPMTLFVMGKITGIEPSFDRTRIEPGEKAVLSIHAAAGAEDGMLMIGVTETKAMMMLQVTVK